MQPLQAQIVNQFLKRLGETKKVDSAKIEALKKAMSVGAKIKVDDLVKILSAPAGGELK